MDIHRQFSRLLHRHLLPLLNGESPSSLSAEQARIFLTLLCEKPIPEKTAHSFSKSHETLSLTRFFKRMLRYIPEELYSWAEAQPQTLACLEQAASYTKEQSQRALFTLFFPEGLELLDNSEREQAIQTLRQKRLLTIEHLNPQPLRDPASEIIFTSNLLITSPLSPDPDKWFMPLDMKPELKQVQNEAQLYWYDHPIPMGMPPEKNEALYGLTGLQEMVNNEDKTQNRKLTVVLSASTTHAGLRPLVKPYFNFLFLHAPELPNLRIYIFTEDDVRVLLRTILKPIADRHFPEADFTALEEVLGVDGEYGRHYSFLKAIAAFWQVFVDSNAKATFKIDLDQVFPQRELKRETGKTALEHFKTPLWGAIARDTKGRQAELGMLAGALVNKNDISKSLFTPDVLFPPTVSGSKEHFIFFSQLPQAQSTLAEMTTRYDGERPDGQSTALQRFHVTGGTNGILIESLFRHKPFTPTFVGRAEDQSYIMSVLFGEQPVLRYVHAPGLIMRHDKEAFAGEAIEAAAAGKVIGDYVRILTFTEYARALPWPLDDIKKELDPFTGAFISHLPYTVVALRFALKICEMDRTESAEEAEAFARLGAERLNAWMDRFPPGERQLQKQLEREQQAWQLYYDILVRAKEERQMKSALWNRVNGAVQRLVEQIRVERKADED